jgi:hypothetical protein
MTWPRRRPAAPENCRGFDIAVVERALVEKHGNVHATAQVLSVSSSDLRRLVTSTPALMDAVFEELECGVDQALAILIAELKNPDIRRRIRAAGFFLRHTEAGRLRGSLSQ